MPIVTFKPMDKQVNVQNGSPLLDAAKELGISVEVPCGGNGVCGKCLVQIASGKVDFENNGILPEILVDDGYVLICKAKVLDEPVCVQINDHLAKEKGSFTAASEDMLLVDKALLPTINDLNPIVKKATLSVAPATFGDGLSDYDRLKKAINTTLGGNEINLPLELLKTLPSVIRENNGEITVSYYVNQNNIQIVNVETNNTLSKNFGLAIDIGTTTVAVKLVDLTSAEILSSKTSYNNQIECGLDVISRINYAKKTARLLELKEKVTATINTITEKLLKRNNLDYNDIYNISIAANTTMVHLLLGIEPEYIRLDPYTPAVFDVPYFKASEIGLLANPNAPVFIAPSVGSYVGGDITSGLLCTDLSTEKEELCLFIDIGTNGELVAGNADFLMGCACSAGPAFEGGGIENGMRASEGAIERVEIEKKSGKPYYSTIGAVAPVGICGSGLITLIANLFTTGWLDAAGKLKRDTENEYIKAEGRSAKYIIVKAEDSGNGKPIYINEADIDNFIRAKGAIFSACVVMLNNIGMGFEDVSKMYIAGGFGRYLNIEKAKKIGLIPNLPTEKFHYLGNSSLTGAYATLISSKHREKEKELAAKITYIDLSSEPTYMDEYTAALFLPHTNKKLFE